MFKLGFELKVYNHNQVTAIVSWLVPSYSTFALLVALPLPALMGVHASRYAGRWVVTYLKAKKNSLCKAKRGGKCLVCM